MVIVNQDLPPFAYTTTPDEKDIVMVKRNERGYYTLNGPWKLHEGQTLDELADVMNAKNGVTRQQRRAMEAGSMFGWHVPGANPRHYGGTV